MSASGDEAFVVSTDPHPALDLTEATKPALLAEVGRRMSA